MTSTLNGLTVTRARVQLPAWGVWWADVEIDEPETLSGAATLAIADRTWAGTIVSGGAYLGRARYRIAGGAGRWGQVIAEKAYANDAGVKVSTVVQDAAREAGETVANLPATRLGAHYARRAGPASAALNLLAPQAWYVDDDGVTQVTARPSSEYTGEATVVDADLSAGVVTLTTDALTGLSPGASAHGLTISDVDIALGAKSLTVTLYGARASTRGAGTVARLINALRPGDAYRGMWEYRVTGQDAERLNLQPVRAVYGLPELTRVPIRYGMPGVKSVHAPGSLVLVSFVNGNPARPAIIGFDDPDSEGWTPDTTTIEATTELLLEAAAIKLGAAAALGAARITDTVIAGGFSGTITSASAKTVVE